ncbi:MAG: hypothetical protein IPN84_12830 [Sphingomonadales bacterium]|jgi:hypothetical protein|nr:hypothetical protein [Sphingomonadales bacterium]
MNEDKAKARFMLLNMVRFSGILFVFAGLANGGGKLLPELAPYLGLALCTIGLIDFFGVPIFLKKAWKKQDGQ